jgi:bla regulator protein BlaR1
MIGEVTNHLWQSTVFAVAAGLLAVTLRKNRAQVRYWLWLSASLKFLVPFAVLISMGSHLQLAPAAKAIAAPPAVAFAMEQIARPFPETTVLT